MRLEVAVVIGLAFFTLQCWFCRETLRYVEGLRRAIEGAKRSAQAGPRRDAEADWLRWVDETFPPESASGWGCGRDEALAMLDEDLERFWGYQWLQRTAVMAPLVGVLITSFGLILLRLPESLGLTMPAILRAVQPLFVGVCTGAILALINQGLLQWVQHGIEVTRSTARRWFDRLVWGPATRVPREAADATLSALEALGTVIRETVRQHEGDRLEVSEAARAMLQVSRKSKQALQSFLQGVGALAVQVDALRDAADSARRAAESLAPAIGQTGEMFTGTVDRFRTAVTDHFLPAANDHLTAARGSLEAMGKTVTILSDVGASTQLLRKESEQLALAVRHLATCGVDLRGSLDGSVLPAHKALLNATTSLNEAARGVPGLAAEASASFSKVAGQLLKAVDDELLPASERLRAVVDREFSPAAVSHRALLDEARQIGDGLSALLGRVNASAAALDERCKGLADVDQRLNEAGTTIDESLRSGFIPAQQSFGTAVASFSDSSKDLARFVEQGVVPSTARLAELAATVGAVRRASESIGALADVKGEIEGLHHLVRSIHETLDASRKLEALEPLVKQFSETLAQAAALGETVSGLPRAFGESLQETSIKAIRAHGQEVRYMLVELLKQIPWSFRQGGNGAAVDELP